MYTTSQSTLYTTTDYGSLAGAGLWVAVSFILAIVGGILVYYLFVAQKQEPKSKFAKQLKSFLSFKTMWIETIAKITYYILTIFTILYSFVFIAVNPVIFLAALILGPIVIRIIYELTIMTIMIWRNTKEIAENTKKKK